MRDPLDDWIREDAAALAGYYSIHQAGVACTRFGRQFLQVLQAPLAAQVAGVVDHALDAKGAVLLQVDLDPGMPEGQVDGDLVGAVQQPGGEGPRGLAGDPGGEDDLGVLGQAQVHVAGQQLLKDGPDPARVVEDQGAGDLDLPHRQLPPAAVVTVGGGQRQRDAVHPVLEEHPQRPGLDHVAQLLQPGRVGGGGEPVRQRRHRDALGQRGAAGDLVAVEPDFDRVRRIRAHLDERRTRPAVMDIEVIAGHQPLGAIKAEPRDPIRAFLPRGVEDPLELPRLPDRDHLRPPGFLRRLQVRAHHVQLPVALAEDHPRDVVAVRVPPDRGPEPLADLAQRRRGRDREPAPAQPPGDLPGRLQGRNPAVEVNPVEPLDLQAHMPGDDVRQRDWTMCHAHPPPQPCLRLRG